MRVAICDDNQQDIERIRRYTLRMIDYAVEYVFYTRPEAVSYTHLDVYKRQEQMVITRTVEMHAQLVGYDFKKKGLPTDKNIAVENSKVSNDYFWKTNKYTEMCIRDRMLFIRRFSKTRKSCGLITGKEWLQFFCVPVFTVVGLSLIHICSP